MPVDEKKMRALKKEYGPEKGERIYYALEQKDKDKKKKPKGFDHVNRALGL
jgi:hypothetical protein